MSEIKLSVDGIEYEPTGKCCVEGNDIVIRYGMHQVIFKPKEVLPKQDHKIVSFIRYDGKIDDIEGKPVNPDWYKDDNDWSIHSVKRLDGEVFTVNEMEGKWGKILKFKIENNIAWAYFEYDRNNDYTCWEELHHLVKVKPKVPLKDIPKDLGYEIFVLEDKTITGAIRLSDGKIFEIGDEVKWMWFVSPKEYITIEGFYLDEEKRLIVKFKEWGAADQLFHIIMNMGFEKKVKPKEPLFTCETGEQIFEDYEDIIWRVFIRNSSYENWKPYDLGIPVYPNEDERYFLKKEDAYEYILNNRPSLSLKEIKDQFNQRDFVGTDYIMQKLRREVKEKLDI